MKFGESGGGRMRCAQTHACAGSCVKHPRSHDDDDARTYLNVDNLACRSLLAVLTPDTTAVQRMPAVKDFDLLADMGRMAQ